MGSFMRVSVSYKNLADWMPSVKLPVYGALLEGENIFTTKAPNGGLLVIGSEGKGIRENILNLITHPVTIPKTGDAESLNAGVAAGIIVAQLTR
jgi:TrmH family RNA methyltransferase